MFVFVEYAEHLLPPKAAEVEESVEVLPGEEFGGRTMCKIIIHKLENE